MNTFDMPVYTAPPEPKSCAVCHRGEAFLRATQGPYATGECSHVACPNRSRVTAQPADRPPATA